MRKKLEEFVTGTGIFEGIKIPAKYRGKYIIICEGRVFGAYNSEQAFGILKTIKEYDSESRALVLHVPDKKTMNAYSAAV